LWLVRTPCSMSLLAARLRTAQGGKRQACAWASQSELVQPESKAHSGGNHMVAFVTTEARTVASAVHATAPIAPGVQCIETFAAHEISKAPVARQAPCPAVGCGTEQMGLRRHSRGKTPTFLPRLLWPLLFWIVVTPRCHPIACLSSPPRPIPSPRWRSLRRGRSLADLACDLSPRSCATVLSTAAPEPRSGPHVHMTVCG